MARLLQASVGPDADEMGDVSYDAMGSGVADSPLWFVALRLHASRSAACRTLMVDSLPRPTRVSVHHRCPRRHFFNS